MSFKILYVENQPEDWAHVREAIIAHNEVATSARERLEIVWARTLQELEEKLDVGFDAVLVEFYLRVDDLDHPMVRDQLDDILEVIDRWKSTSSGHGSLPVVALTGAGSHGLRRCLERRSQLYDILDKNTASPEYIAWRLSSLATAISQERAVRAMGSRLGPPSEDIVAPARQVLLVSATELILKSLRNNISGIYELTPDQFELLICDRLDAMDFEVNRVGKINTPDGGVDIVSWPKKAAFPYLLAVQVKHRSRPSLRVGPGPVKDLKAVVQSSPFDAGLLVTNTSFTPDARWWARNGPQAVRLRDLEDLRRWIAGSFLGEEIRDLPRAIEVAPGLTIPIRVADAHSSERRSR